MSELGWIAVGALVAILGALRAAFSPCGQSMLASLTPYAEAARGSRWAITATSFSVGAVTAGACGGLVWGGLGSLLPGGGWRLVVAAAVLAGALVIDATPLRTRLPLTKRQVNEDWMVTYRGWVYGVGFGAQLGLGFVTLVACAAIYATFAIEFLSGSVIAGVTIGAIFGATKAGSLLPARWARDRHSLVDLHRRLLTLEPFSIGAVAAAEVAAVAILVGAIKVKVAAYGISIEVPPSWEARIEKRGYGAVLHVASFALHSSDGDFGAAATGRMRRGDAFAALVEYVDRESIPPGVGLYAAGRPPTPALHEFAPMALQVTRPGHLGWQRFFTHAGRTCCLYAVIKPGAERPARLVRRLGAVLATLAIEG